MVCVCSMFVGWGGGGQVGMVTRCVCMCVCVCEHVCTCVLCFCLCFFSPFLCRISVDVLLALNTITGL